MKRKLSALILLFTVLVTFTGCTEVQSFLKGDVTGELDKTYSTQWFDFSVNSIETAYEYGGETLEEGYKFVIAEVTERNTFDEAIPMSCYDFEINGEGIEGEDIYPADPEYFSLSVLMMPSEFQLEVDEIIVKDVVFVIPEDVLDIQFVYIELDEDQNVGATFKIEHTLSE